MVESDASFNDKKYREETRQVWQDLGNTTDELRDGPHKGVDLVSDDYDIEVAFSTIWGQHRSEWRLEQRKLKYWKTQKPCHYIVFNKEKTECVIWGNKVIREWIKTFPVEYRHCKGWNRINCWFLIIPLALQTEMKSLKKDKKKWVLTQPIDTY
jgi:hypothetical protein